MELGHAHSAGHLREASAAAAAIFVGDGQQPGRDAKAYHAVKGKLRIGLIVDPGASVGIMGTDTLLEHCEGAVRPAGMDIEISDSHTILTGIDGNGTPGVAHVKMPLGLPGLAAVFAGDLMGGSGSRCPGLMPLDTMLRFTMCLIAACLPVGSLFTHVFYAFTYLLSLSLIIVALYVQMPYFS